MGGYGSMARIYDGEYRRFTQDLDFYLDRLGADRVLGGVLEAGCGTGRVAAPLAAAGYRVTAFDNSEAMLRRARRRRRTLEPETRMRLCFACKDMTGFSFRARFRAAVIAFSTFNLLSTAAARAACLRCLQRQLEPGGLLLMDVANGEAAEPFLQASRARQSRHIFLLPPFGHEVTKTVDEQDDPSAQLTSVRYRYEARRFVDQRLLSRFEVAFALARLSRREVEQALFAAGFDVEEVCGDYQGRPFTSTSDRMLFQARRLPV